MNSNPDSDHFNSMYDSLISGAFICMSWMVEDGKVLLYYNLW